MSFALFLEKNLHLSFSPLKWRLVHTFRCRKCCTLRYGSNSPSRTLRFASVKWRDRGSKNRNKRSNFRRHRPSSQRKKWIKWMNKWRWDKNQMNTKNYWKYGAQQHNWPHFKGSVEWSRHERHFCSLLPYFLQSWLQIFQLCLSFWTSSFDTVLLEKFLQEKEKYPKNLPKRLSS